MMWTIFPGNFEFILSIATVAWSAMQGSGGTFKMKISEGGMLASLSTDLNDSRYWSRLGNH